MRFAPILAIIALASPIVVQAQEPSTQEFRKAIAAADIRKAMDAVADPAQKAWLNQWNANGSSPIAMFLQEPFNLALTEPTLEEFEALRATIPQGMGGFSPADLDAVGAGADASHVWFPSEAALIQGLSDFLVERAKDEVIYAFVVRLQDAEHSCFVKEAFARSLRALEAIEPQTFQTVMPLLRAAVQTDLDELAPRLGQREFRSDACLPAQASMQIEVAAALYPVVRSISRGSSPAMALAELTRIDTVNVPYPDIVAGLDLIGAVASDYSVYGDELTTRITERPVFFPRYYLAFLGRKVLEANYPNLAPQDQPAMDRFELGQGQLVSFVLQLDAANDALIGAASQGVGISAGVAIHSGISLLDAAAPLLSAQTARIDSVRSALVDVAYVHDLVVARDYPQLVLWVAEKVSLWSDAKDVRFLGFAANLAAAGSAEEVEQVLHTAAAPIGSYRAKRNQVGEWGPRSASVVAYVGAGVGRERGGPGPATHIGAAIPLGVEVSWGAPFGALSFFAPLIDLGTVASLRLGDDDVETMPEVGFRQVLAPGLYLMIHAGSDLPLTFGVGVQAVNDLRKTEGTDTRFDITRWSLIGGIDATVFNIAW